MMQMETQALRQQLQEDWEAGEAERQELLHQLHAQAAIAAAKVSILHPARLDRAGLLSHMNFQQRLICCGSVAGPSHEKLTSVAKMQQQDNMGLRMLLGRAALPHSEWQRTILSSRMGAMA